MKIVQIKEPGLRGACLARLCAEVYGQKAGLAPLVVFTGTQNVLFEQEAARLVAGVNGEGELLALALLVLDEQGVGMTPQLVWERRNGARARLIKALGLNVPLTVKASSDADEAFYRAQGIKRWFDSATGERIGLNTHHPAADGASIAPTIALDHDLILRRFKHDPKAFAVAKRAFLEGLERAPNAL